MPTAVSRRATLFFLSKDKKSLGGNPGFFICERPAQNGIPNAQVA